ncbi:hypothetical protein V2J09_006869 [Rumex salicifolius]
MVVESGEMYSGKITRFVLVSCIMAAMGGLLFGYDIGSAGGVSSMDSFLRKFFPKVYTKMKEDHNISNYCKFNSQLLTTFTSSLYVAGLFTTFLASWVTASLGRRPSILAGGIAFLAGSALGGAAVNVYMAIFSRVLLGVGVGFANQAVPLYLSEMAPVQFRGGFSNAFQFSLGVGSVIASLINFGSQKIKAGWGWRVSLAMGALPATFLTLGAIFLPETPNSLIQRTTNGHVNARLMLQKIRGADVDVGPEFNDLVEANLASKKSNDPLKTLLKLSYRPQLIMAVLIPAFQQLTGINVIGFYAPLLFRTIGFGESASLLSGVITGIVGVTATFTTMLVVDRFGRRALLLFGGGLMLVSQVMIGIILGLKLKDHGEITRGYAYVVLVLVFVYVAGFSWSWGPLGWLIPSEIFQLEVRSAAQSVTVAVSFVFTFSVAQMFLAMLCGLKAGIFFFFGGWVVVMTAFVYWLLPETGNIPMEKMDRIWREHWYWSRFVDQKESDLDA